MCMHAYVCVISCKCCVCVLHVSCVLCVSMCECALCTGSPVLTEFLIRDEASEVKVIVEKAGEPEDKLKEVYARFQGLVCINHG